MVPAECATDATDGFFCKSIVASKDVLRANLQQNNIAIIWNSCP